MRSPVLEQIDTWPVDNVAAAIVRLSPTSATPDVVESRGPTDRVFRLASLSKPMAAWATLVAVEEGIVSFDDPIGRGPRSPGDPPRTLRHVLAHTGGYGFDSARPIMAPERKRIYSNSGYDAIGTHVAAAADMPFADYLSAAVFEPLGMTSSRLDGSPAHQIHSTVDDVVAFLAETVTPRLVTSATAQDARRTQWPELGGIVPGVGRFETCPWGLGLEIRGDKSPHWTGRANSPDTYGHFGGSGTMMWVDPATDPAVGVVALTDRRFDEWAPEALRRWPELSDAALQGYAGVV